MAVDGIALIFGPQSAKFEHMTPKWSGEHRFRRSRLLLFLAMVFIVIVAILAVVTAKKYPGKSTGQNPQEAPWLKQK